MDEEANDDDDDDDDDDVEEFINDEEEELIGEVRETRDPPPRSGGSVPSDDVNPFNPPLPLPSIVVDKLDILDCRCKFSICRVKR